MIGARLHDRHWYALGIAARHVGEWVDAYRPSGPGDPLDRQHRFLKLPASFISAKANGEARTNLYGDPFWHGVFDASYTRPGDYMVSREGVFFVASQLPLLPILCVKTNRTISIGRPELQAAISANSYGGFTQGSYTSLMQCWPASVMTNSRYGQSESALPTDQPAAYISILMPAIEAVRLTTGDIVDDDLGRAAVLVGAELTELGWRLEAKVITN